MKSLVLMWFLVEALSIAFWGSLADEVRDRHGSLAAMCALA